MKIRIRSLVFVTTLALKVLSPSQAFAEVYGELDSDTGSSVPEVDPEVQRRACESMIASVYPWVSDETRRKIQDMKFAQDVREASAELLSLKIRYFIRKLETDPASRQDVLLYRQAIEFQRDKKAPLRRLVKHVRKLLATPEAKEKAGLRRVDCDGAFSSKHPDGSFRCKPLIDLSEATNYGWQVDPSPDKPMEGVEEDDLDLYIWAVDNPTKVDENRTVHTGVRLGMLLEAKPDSPLFSSRVLLEKVTGSLRSFPDELEAQVLTLLPRACGTSQNREMLRARAQAETDQVSEDRTVPSTGTGGAPAVDPSGGVGGAPAQ